MNARMLQITGGAAVVLAVLAAWATKEKDSSGAATAEKPYLFPGLISKANDVAAIEIANKDGSFTVEKMDGAWALASKGGYPVSLEKVKELVGQIALFEIRERKTTDPELYSKLQVEDVTAEAAASSRVTLKDGSGAALADVIIGKTAPGGGPTISSLYVRKSGDPQSYEVSGKVWIDATETNWLDKAIVKIERTRIHRTTVTHPDGSKLEVFKTAPDEKNYSVVDLAPGAELKWPGVADGVAGALEYLNFEDVQPSGGIDFNDPAAVTTRFQTFDGLLVTARLLEKDGKWYSHFSTAFDPAARVEVTTVIPPAPPAPVAPLAPLSNGELPPPEATPTEPTVEKKVPGKVAEVVEKEAKDFEERLAKWDFVLPGYNASNFTKKLADMLKEAAPLGPLAPTDEKALGNPPGNPSEEPVPEPIEPPPSEQLPSEPPAAGTEPPPTPPAELPPSTPPDPKPPGHGLW